MSIPFTIQKEYKAVNSHLLGSLSLLKMASLFYSYAESVIEGV
jgi:hypothetical protein